MDLQADLLHHPPSPPRSSRPDRSLRQLRSNSELQGVHRHHQRAHHGGGDPLRLLAVRFHAPGEPPQGLRGPEVVVAHIAVVVAVLSAAV